MQPTSGDFHPNPGGVRANGEQTTVLSSCGKGWWVTAAPGHFHVSTFIPPDFSPLPSPICGDEHLPGDAAAFQPRCTVRVQQAINILCNKSTLLLLPLLL